MIGAVDEARQKMKDEQDKTKPEQEAEHEA